MNLDTTYAALADPTRRAILARLAEGEATVGEIAEPFPISGPAISRHLKVLEEAQLIARTRNGQQLICRLNPYTRLPKNENTGLSTGLMKIGMLPPAAEYKPRDLNHTIASMGIEVERNYKPVWNFKGQDQTVQSAVRIPYRFPVYGHDEGGKGKQLLYWQTEYLLLGFVGGGGMG